ncbi:MAG: neutral/alkaline non-lysosomal ceramidase N-terminal domain-containing protein [Candidatus Omnitrophica bacterium]|nr:neutral/alkaline non-lysosomal ceramidase N-terminal domain-containing protein [Candidatus Omnitrophota bacterium]
MMFRFVGLLLLLGIPFGAVHAEPFLAGKAETVITPPLALKTSLGGYGERMSQPATGIHDDLRAKALVFVQGDKKFALVTADALGFPPPFKEEIVKKIGDPSWTVENIMLLPSHSHTSFDMSEINPKNEMGIPQLGIFNLSLYTVLSIRFSTLIQDAERDLAPITIGTESAFLKDWVRNRRDGEEVTDQVLTVTRIDDEEGNPFAVFANFAAHPTFMSAKDMMFSGGWPGHLQRTVEALIGDEVECLFSNGAEGDQSPIARRRSGNSSWERAERYGRELGIEVYRLWKEIETQPVEKFEYSYEKLELPTRTWHPDFMATGGAEYGLREDLMDLLIDQMVPEESACGFLRLNDLLIIGIPGEMTAEIGKKLRDQVAEKTGVKHPIIGGLANEWISYILSPEQYNGGGGYEASVSFYGPQLGPTVMAAALKGAEKLE